MVKDGKIGFNQFRAFNVNIAAPEADRKWSLLQQIVQDYASDSTSNYPNNLAFNRMVEIAQNAEEPDKLMEFGKSLQAFVESADEQTIKEDKKITKIVEIFATTAKASRDQRIIDAAIDISNAIIDLKKK